MAGLLLSVFVSLLILAAFGMAVSKFTGTAFPTVEKLLLGLVLANTLTASVSLFLPVDGQVLSVFLAVSLLLLWIAGSDFQNFLQLFRQNKKVLLLAFPFVCIAFVIALNPPANYDSALYHIQAIKWIEAYHAIPGLANLHGRFGFNPNIFSFFSLTSLHGLFGQEIFSVNFTVFCILACYYIKRMLSLYEGEGMGGFFLFFLIQFLLLLGLYNLSSPSPDFLSAALTLFIFCRWADLSRQTGTRFASFWPLIVLSVYLLTIKLATLPILLLFVFTFIRFRPKFRPLLQLSLLHFLIMAPWLARNCITSGWLLYPFPSVDLFDFDWKVPIENVISEKQTITSTARTKNLLVLDFSQWFPIWWNEMGLILKLLLVAGVVVPVVVFFQYLTTKDKSRLFIIQMILTSFCGVVFWFLLAPDWRFGQAFVIMASLPALLYVKKERNFGLLSLSVGILMLFYGWYTMGKTGLVLLPLVLLLLMVKPLKSGMIFPTALLLLLLNYIKSNQLEIEAVFRSSSPCLIRPMPMQTPDNIRFLTYKIDGLTIYRPNQSDRCYDHQLPCSPYYDPALRLRKNTIGSGFRSDLSATTKNKGTNQ